jgi:hypothetical protein
MSCGSLFGRDDRKPINWTAGVCGESEATTASGSAVCAQHPQVTQVGGQVPSSSWPPVASSRPLHGSSTTRLDTPDTLSVRNATSNARTNRPTWPLYIRAIRRAVRWAMLRKRVSRLHCRRRVPVTRLSLSGFAKARGGPDRVAPSLFASNGMCPAYGSRRILWRARCGALCWNGLADQKRVIAVSIVVTSPASTGDSRSNARLTRAPPAVRTGHAIGQKALARSVCLSCSVYCFMGWCPS